MLLLDFSRFDENMGASFFLLAFAISFLPAIAQIQENNAKVPASCIVTVDSDSTGPE